MKFQLSHNRCVGALCHAHRDSLCPWCGCRRGGVVVVFCITPHMLIPSQFLFFCLTTSYRLLFILLFFSLTSLYLSLYLLYTKPLPLTDPRSNPFIKPQTMVVSHYLSLVSVTFVVTATVTVTGAGVLLYLVFLTVSKGSWIIQYALVVFYDEYFLLTTRCSSPRLTSISPSPLSLLLPLQPNRYSWVEITADALS